MPHMELNVACDIHASSADALASSTFRASTHPQRSDFLCNRKALPIAQKKLSPLNL